MKIGIIGVMDQEVKILKEKLTDAVLRGWAGALFVSGSLERHGVIVIRSGIGKVASTVATALLVHQYGANTVINTGSADGIGEGLEVGNLVIADKLVYFNVNVTGFGHAYGQLPGDVPLYFGTGEYLRMETAKAAEKAGLAIRRGLIVTEDTFANSAGKIAKIKKEFPGALACEMEGAAIGQVVSQFNIPLLATWAMSNTANGEAIQSSDEFIDEAGKKLAEMVIHLVENLV